MSLSAELRSPTSPLRRFFEVRLGDVAAVAAGWPGGVRVVVPRPRVPGYPAAAVGGAFDYRLRMLLQALGDPRRLAAAAGVRNLVNTFSPPEARDDWLALVATVFDQLPDPPEPERVCYVLALFEQLYRTGRWTDTPLHPAHPPSDPDGLLALAPDACVADLRALTRAFEERHAALRERPVVGNPTFSGSDDVFGADADLLLGSCLVDVKTMARARDLPSEWLWQLAGYVLLDYGDAYAIDEVAIYLSRHAELVRWGADELLQTLAGDRPVTRTSLRTELRELLRRARP